eukprot:g14159.t1
MSEASADERVSTPGVPGPPTGLQQLRRDPAAIEKIQHVENVVDREGVGKVTASVPSSGSTASNPIDPEEKEHSHELVAPNSLGVPTTVASIRSGGGGKETKREEEPQKKQEKEDLGSSAVSRLRQMFERNNSDSKKRGSLEARTIPRPIATMAVSSIREREVIKETAAVVGLVSVGAAEESASLDATASLQLPAVGPQVLEIAPVVTLKEMTGAGPAAIALPSKEVASSAAEENRAAAAVVGAVAQDDPSVLAQPALLPAVDTSSTSSMRMDESSLPQAATWGKAAGVSVISSPANVWEEEHRTAEEEAPEQLQQVATTQVAGRETSGSGVPLQKLIIGPDPAALKASEPADGGSASAVYRGEQRSPDAGVVLPGSARDHAVADEVPLAATSISDNDGPAAGDETPLVGDVAERGVMSNPLVLGASIGASSTVTTGMNQAPIATVEDVIQTDAPSVRPGAIGVAEGRSEDLVQAAEVTAEVTAVSEFAGELLATGSNVALPASVDDGQTEQEKADNEEVVMAGEGLVIATAADIPAAVPDATGTATDKLAAIDAPVSGVGVEDSTTVSISKGVHAEVEPMVLGAQTQPEQRVVDGKVLVEENSSTFLAAATDGESGAGEAIPVSTEPARAEAEQLVEELVGEEPASAEVDTVYPAGADTLRSSERAGGVEPAATQLASLVVDEAPAVEAAASIVEDSSANAATSDSPIKSLVESAAADNTPVDAGPETAPTQPVLVTEAPVEGGVTLAESSERKDDEVDGELNVAGAAPLSRVEKLRQMFDQKQSPADEQTEEGDVSIVAQDAGEVEVARGKALAAEQHSNAPAAVGGILVAHMSLSPAEEAEGEGQAGALEVADHAPDKGDLAIDGALLDTAKPTTIAVQPPDADTTDQSRIATVDSVIEADASSTTPNAVSAAEASSEEGVLETQLFEVTPVAEQSVAPEGSEHLAAAGSHGALPTLEDNVVVADAVDAAVDDALARHDKTVDEKGVAGEWPVVASAAAVPDDVSDAKDTATDDVAVIGAPVSDMRVEDATTRVSGGDATARQEVSITLDDVRTEVKPAATKSEDETERPVSATDGLVEEDSAGVPAAAKNGKTGTGQDFSLDSELVGADAEQTAEGFVQTDMVSAEVDTAVSPAGDGTVGSSEETRSAEPVESHLSSLVVDEAHGVKGAASIVDDPSADAAMKHSPIEQLAGKEAGVEQLVPVTEALLGGDSSLAAAAERKDVEMDEELQGAAPRSRVEKLREMFDQSASRADEEIPEGHVVGAAEDKDAHYAGKSGGADEVVCTADASIGVDNAQATVMSPSECSAEGERPGGLETEGSAPGDDDVAGAGNGAGAVLGTGDPPAVEDQRSEKATADEAPTATVADVIMVDASCETPDAVPVAEAGLEEGAQVAAPSEASAAVVQVHAMEVSQDLAVTGSDGALSASAEVPVVHTVDGAVEGGQTEQEKTGDEEVDTPGEWPMVATAAAVADAVPDAVNTATDELAAIRAPVFDVGVEDSTPSLSAGVAAGDELPAILGDVQPEVEPVAPEETTEPELPRSARGEFAEGDGAAVSVAAMDGETGAGVAITQRVGVDDRDTAEELVGDGMASIEVDTVTPAGAGTTGSSEGADRAEPLAIQLSAAVVDEATEAEAAASIVEGPSTDEAAEDSLIEQLGANAAKDDPVVDAGPETEAEPLVPVTEVSVEGGASSAAAMERKDDEVDEELNVANAASLSPVGELREMLDQKTSDAVAGTPEVGVPGVAEGDDAHQAAEECEQPGGRETEESVLSDGDIAFAGAGAVLDMGNPSAVKGKLREEATADVAPIATVNDDIQVDASSVTPDAVSTAEAGSEEEAQVAKPVEEAPVAVEGGAPEVSADVAATGSDGAPPASVEVVVADTVGGTVDDGHTKQEKTGDEEVNMAGDGPFVARVAAVPDAVPDAIDTATGELGAIIAPVSDMGVEDSTLSLSAGAAAAGGEVLATLDDVQSEVGPMAPDEEAEPQRSCLTSDRIVEEDGAAVPAAALDGESAGEGLPVSTEPVDVESEQTFGELVRNVAARAGVETANPAGADEAGSSEAAVSLAPNATQLPSAVVDEGYIEPVTLGASGAEVRSEDWVQVGHPSVPVPLSVGGDTEAEVSQQPEATASTGELPASADTTVADTVGSAVDSETTERDNRDDEEMITAGEDPVSTTVSAAASDEIKAVADHMAPTSTPVSGGGVNENTRWLPVDSTALKHGVSSSASLADEMSGGAEVGAFGVSAPGEQVVGDEVSSTLDGDHASEAQQSEPEQRVSASDALVEEEGAVGAEAAGTVKEPMSGDTAPAEAFLANPEDDAADRPSGVAQRVEFGEIQPLTLAVDELPKVEPAAAIFGYPESRADAVGARIEQLIEDAVSDALIGADPGTELEPSIHAAESAAEAGVVGAPEGANAAEMMPLSAGSAGAESTAVNELEIGDTTPAGADTTSPVVDGDKNGSFETVKIVEHGEAQPAAGDAPSDAGLGTGRERPVPEAEAAADNGVLVEPAAPCAAEEACVGDTALTPAEWTGVESEQAEVAGAVELASCSVAPARLDAEAPAPVPTGRLLSPDAAAVVSAEGDSEPIEAVRDSSKTAAEERSAGRVEDTEPAATHESVFSEDERLAATSLEAPVRTPDAINDVYNLKVQVGVEHAFPVVALDAPVAQVSPLARHFAAFDREEETSATAGASTLPVADEHGPGMNEEGTVDTASQRLRVLSPVAAVDEAARSEGTSEVSATDNSTLDNAAAADLPSPGAEGTSASAGVQVYGITKSGMVDTTATFGVVDLSALMAEESAGEVSPNSEPLAPTARARDPRRSLSPGWKGYVNADASSASPEAEGPAGTVDQAGVSPQALPGDIEARKKKDCVIS